MGPRLMHHLPLSTSQVLLDHPPCPPSPDPATTATLCTPRDWGEAESQGGVLAKCKSERSSQEYPCTQRNMVLNLE